MGFLRLLGLGKSARLAREATAQLAREAATTIDKGEKERLSVGDLAAHNHNGQRVGQIALTRALEELGWKSMGAMGMYRGRNTTS
jgi:hypothetical protein